MFTSCKKPVWMNQSPCKSSAGESIEMERRISLPELKTWYVYLIRSLQKTIAFPLIFPARIPDLQTSSRIRAKNRWWNGRTIETDLRSENLAMEIHNSAIVCQIWVFRLCFASRDRETIAAAAGDFPIGQQRAILGSVLFPAGGSNCFPTCWKLANFWVQTGLEPGTQ